MSIHDLIPHISGVPALGADFASHHLLGLNHGDWFRYGPIIYATPKSGHTWKALQEEQFAPGLTLAQWTRGWQYLLHLLWFTKYGVIEGLGDDLGPHQSAVFYELVSATPSGTQVFVRRRESDPDPWNVDGNGLVLPPGGELIFNAPSWLSTRKRWHVAAIPLTGPVAVDETFTFELDQPCGMAGDKFIDEEPITVGYRYWIDRGVEAWRRVDDLEPDYFAPTTIEVFPTDGVFGNVALVENLIRYWKSWIGGQLQLDFRYFRVIRHLAGGGSEDATAAVAPYMQMRDTPSKITYANLAPLGWTSADTAKLEFRVWVESESEGRFTGQLRCGRCRHSAKDYSGSIAQAGGRYCDEPQATQRAAFLADCQKAGWCSHYEPARPQHPLDPVALKQILVLQPWVAEGSEPENPTYVIRRALQGRVIGVEGGLPSIASICDINLEAMTGYEAPVVHIYKGGWQGLLSNGMPARGHERDFATGELGPFAWPDKPAYLHGGAKTEAQEQGCLNRALDVDVDGAPSGSIGNYVRSGYEATFERFEAQGETQQFGDGHVFERGAWDGDLQPCAPGDAVYRWRVRFADNSRIVGYATVRKQSYGEGVFTLELQTGVENCQTNSGGETISTSFFAGGNIVRPPDPWRVNNRYASGRKRGADIDGGAVPGYAAVCGGHRFWVIAARPYAGEIQPCVYGGAEYDEHPTGWNAQWDELVAPHAASLPPPRDWGYGRGFESARDYLHRGDVIELLDEHGRGWAAGLNFEGMAIELRNGGVAHWHDENHKPRVWIDGVEVAESDLLLLGAAGYLYGAPAIEDGNEIEMLIHLTQQRIDPATGIRHRYAMPVEAAELNHLTASLDNLWLLCSREAISDLSGIRARPADGYGQSHAASGGDFPNFQSTTANWGDLIEGYDGPHDGAQLVAPNGPNYFAVLFGSSGLVPPVRVHNISAEFNLQSGPWRIPELDALPVGADAVRSAVIDLQLNNVRVLRNEYRMWIDSNPEGGDSGFTQELTTPSGTYFHVSGIQPRTQILEENPQLSLILAGYDREDATHAELRILAPVGSIVPGYEQRIDATAFVKAYLQNKGKCRAFELLMYPPLNGVQFDFTGEETRLEAFRKLVNQLVQWSSGPTLGGDYNGWTYFVGELATWEVHWSLPTISRIMVNLDWSVVTISGGLQYGPLNSNGM